MYKNKEINNILKEIDSGYENLKNSDLIIEAVILLNNGAINSNFFFKKFWKFAYQKILDHLKAQ